MYNDNRRCGETNPWRPLAVLLLATTTASGAWAHGWHGSHHGPPPPPPPPIVLQDSGGFIIGGQHKVIDPAAPNRTLSCDHGYDLCTDPNASNCGFGPIGVTQNEFKKLARLHIQFVWGDHRGPNDFAFVYPFVEQSRLCAKLINKYAADNGLPGHAEVLMLGDDAGLKGSSHIAFADIDNDKVAALLFKFLHKSGLDRYAGHHHGW